MTAEYPFLESLQLHVPGRIQAEDAHRQEQTAREILKRLSDLPGLVLADEVGMGKTFVALAVAVSVALADHKQRPVVVMVPSSLHQKWPADFEVFREKCLPPEVAKTFRYGQAQRAVEFLKMLDDPPNRRKRIIFLTHGVMSRGLKDRWVMLALIHQALRYRRGGDELRSLLSQRLGELLGLKWVEKQGIQIWLDLFAVHPNEWLSVLRKWNIDPENDNDHLSDDDPVPAKVCDVLSRLDTDEVYQKLLTIPKRDSVHYYNRMKETRQVLLEALRNLWQECIQKLHLQLPLLILDEAHHLKNPHTKLASLFKVKEAQEDMEQINRGPLGEVFERMLFLTATPFQLGHQELCSVLSRFDGIAWYNRNAPRMDRASFKAALDNLRSVLDKAQEAAVRLDQAWGRLRDGDLTIHQEPCTPVSQWWERAQAGAGLTPAADLVIREYRRTQEKMREAEAALRPWVIRHLKSRYLASGTVARRLALPGRGILLATPGGEEMGIPVEGHVLLPFLLAARASIHAPDSRPVFAEGLASSYEAFLHTRLVNRKREEKETDQDDDDESADPFEITDALRWYLDQLEIMLPAGDPAAMARHPKVAATVERAVALWRQREKVLVFCHYVATGKSLRQWISDAIQNEIVQMGSQKLKCDPADVLERLDLLGKRFFDTDSPIRQACDRAVSALLESYPTLADSREKLQNIVRRNVRTPTFLVRYFPLEEEHLTAESMSRALDTPDQSGMTLRVLLHNFFHFLVEHCSQKDRQEYLESLESIQTGVYLGRFSSEFVSPGDEDMEGAERLVPNVRLVNGRTRPDLRRRLMLTFNTPFYPDVLIASSVMAEGVDLHLNCRYIIHHDLCWNPSTLEQRTGRVDRIGAKVERCGQPIHIYLPYIAETQDEKMYRVVMDRQRWFSVVMGERYDMDAKTTDKLAARVPFPESAASALAFNLT